MHKVRDGAVIFIVHQKQANPVRQVIAWLQVLFTHSCAVCDLIATGDRCGYCVGRETGDGALEDARQCNVCWDFVTRMCYGELPLFVTAPQFITISEV